MILIPCEYQRLFTDAIHNEINLCASKNLIIFTCPGHDFMYKFQTFMHKILGNMLTDEWKFQEE